MSASKSIGSLDRADAAFSGDLADLSELASRLQRRLEREHAARHQAERLLESKSLELFASHQRLVQLNADLEQRVEARTRQVDDARQAAVELSVKDHLTAIANRLHYSQQLELALFENGRNGRVTGLLLLDLDGFKQINDTYGHSYGDEVLVILANRLKRLARRNDLVARVGGDEFAVILEGGDGRAIASAARRFARIFDRSVTIHGVTITCRGSLGLAISPDHCANSVDLQRFADLALYTSKKRAAGEVVIFEKSFLQAYEYRQRMEAEFRTALAGGAIDLVYQPIISLDGGRIAAVEALARWTDSNGAEISPAYFIPLAEECGIIRGVGHSLLEKALLETRDWLQRGLIKRLSFNVSPLELQDESFPMAIMSTLEKFAVDPAHLLLEITEGAALHNMGLAEWAVRRLQAHGVKFALDDFGCGYSDLSTIRKLPITVLKIDRSLLVDAESDGVAEIILRNVVSLCRELGIQSICEGAETKSQIDFLQAIGCDFVQGFAAGRPRPAAEIETSLQHPLLL